MPSTTTHRDALEFVQAALLEALDGGLTARVPLWTATEWHTLLAVRHRRFLEQSGLVLDRVDVGTSAAAGVVALPDRVLAIRRAAWVTSAGVERPLQLLSAKEVDLAAVLWASARQTPRGVLLLLTPARQARLVPPPRDAGTLRLTALVIEQELPTVPGSNPIALTTPDDWSAYPAWGVLADLLGRSGPAFDPARAAYAEAQVEEGVGLARLLLDEITGVAASAAGQGGAG